MASNTLVASRRDGGAMSAAMRAAHRSSITRSDAATARCAGGPPLRIQFEMVAG